MTQHCTSAKSTTSGTNTTSIRIGEIGLGGIDSASIELGIRTVGIDFKTMTSKVPRISILEGFIRIQLPPIQLARTILRIEISASTNCEASETDSE